MKHKPASSHRRLGACLLLLSLAAAPAARAAETNAPPAPSVVEGPAPARAMLWAVQGASNTVYLLGSLHMLRREHYPLDPRIEAAYVDSQLLVTEVDLAQMDTPEAQRAFIARGTLPEGQTLHKILPRATYTGAVRQLGNLGLDMAPFESFRPWLLAMTLTLAKLNQLGFDPALGVDVHVDRRARQDGKPVEALESVEDQIRVFDTLTEADAEALLRFTILEVSRIGTEVERLIAAWRTGDTNAVQEILLEGFDAFPHLQQQLLTDRNQAWTRALARYLADGRNVLVVVGAAHLVGPDGVVALLQQQGFSAQQR